MSLHLSSHAHTIVGMPGDVTLSPFSLPFGDTSAVLTDEAQQEQAARILSFHAAPLAAIRVHA